MGYIKLYEETQKCEACSGMSTTGALCAKCEEAGWWIDPAGGVHDPEDNDPVSMYEALHSKMDGSMKEYGIQDFKKFFRDEYPYITHDQRDSEIQKFIDKHKNRNLAKTADFFQDYLVSQGLADIQETNVEKDMKHLEVFEYFMKGHGPSGTGGGKVGKRIVTVDVHATFDTGSEKIGEDGGQEAFDAKAEELGLEFENAGTVTTCMNVDISTNDLASLLGCLSQYGITSVMLDFT